MNKAILPKAFAVAKFTAFFAFGRLILTINTGPSLSVTTTGSFDIAKVNRIANKLYKILYFANYEMEWETTSSLKFSTSK